MRMRSINERFQEDIFKMEYDSKMLGITDKRLIGVWYWFFNPQADIFEATRDCTKPEGWTNCWIYFGRSEDGTLIFKEENNE